MHYRILGPLEVRDGNQSLPLGGAKQRALLALLVLNANRVVSRERMIDELWQEEPPETAVAIVQVYISRLRKLLPAGVLVTRPPGYLLVADPEAIDVACFERLLAAVNRAEPEQAARLLREALELWRGSPLAELGEPFAQIERGRLEDLRQAALEERIEADLALGRENDLVGEIEALIGEHPYRERLRGQLMLALYRAGRQAEALAAYRDARAALHKVGIEPGPELRRLERQILTQGVTPPPRKRATNVPVQPTQLIGRTHELAEILELVQSHRLVTLTGPGGSGKTRLALAAARELLGDFADGVWFVSLASLTDPVLVEPTIAQTLNARGELNEFLRGKHLLLILDNLEQLLPEACEAVAGLEAKVLATSRERLNVGHEREYGVPTLPLGDAVALFTERARQLQGGFRPDEHVIELARRLDGLPLALELAAARVKLLTPGQIVERLVDSLDLLSGGGRDRPERQRTLRATLEWSYALLSDTEQQLFARLAIFAASFDVPTAEVVVDATVDQLQSLLDKSLLRRTSDKRLLMLDTLRTFALERLPTQNVEALRRRLFDFLLERAEQLRVDSGEGERAVWFNELDVVVPDIRAALSWALEREPVPATRLICQLRAFWAHRGRMREGLTWLERALVHRDVLTDEMLADALLSVGSARLLLNDPEGAAEPLRESIELARRLDDRLAAANASAWYAKVMSARGSHANALSLCEETVAELRDLGHELAVNATIITIGETLLELGDYARARATLNEGLALAERRGDAVGIAVATAGLANLELDQRRLDDAEGLFARTLAIAREIGNAPRITYSLAGLASVAALRGEMDAAGELWGRAESLEEQTATGIVRWERDRYERIIGSAESDDAFRRGYEKGFAEVSGHALTWSNVDSQEVSRLRENQATSKWG